jgi:hypothetical protein
MTQSVSDSNNLRKVVTLHFATHEFLVELYTRAAQSGLMHPSEMVIAGHAWNEINAAQTVQLSIPPVEPPSGAAEGAAGGSDTEPLNASADRSLQP